MMREDIGSGGSLGGGGGGGGSRGGGKRKYACGCYKRRGREGGKHD